MIERARFRLGDGRKLIIGKLSDQLPSSEEAMAVLVPAYSDEDCRRVEKAIVDLVRAGSREFCCVRPKANTMEDDIDAVLEGEGHVDIVTTSDIDETEAVDYFIHAAGGRAVRLVALVDEHLSLVAKLAHAASER